MIIVISTPSPLKDEYEIIHQLFEEGLEVFHLRKIEYSENEIRKFIEGISEKYFERIVLHSHYHLAEKYNLKGIHVPVSFDNEISDRSISVSFHSLDEILKFKQMFNYGFLSPIFDSISKEGYRSRFHLNEVKDFLKYKEEKIIALGGIREDKIDVVKDAGFAGVALLGAIWQNQNPVDTFKRIKEKWLKRELAY